VFGNGGPRSWAAFLPGWGPGRVIVGGAFSRTFHAAGPLMIALGWAVALALIVALVLRRVVATRNISRRGLITRP
jgi:hypothetical protein